MLGRGGAAADVAVVVIASARVLRLSTQRNGRAVHEMHGRSFKVGGGLHVAYHSVHSIQGQICEILSAGTI